MRHIFSALIIAGSLSLAGATHAAPPPPPWNWTGFYVGLNAGGSIGHNPTTEVNETFGIVIGTPTLSPSGFIGGAQLGYNFQFAPHWVIGIEGDFQGTTQHDSNCVGIGCTVAGSFYFTDDQKLKWFATLRGRLAYADGNWLFYVTGGGAWGEIHNDYRTFTPTDASFSADFNVSGWTIGGGAELYLRDGWSAKLEYLYLDLGNFTDGGLDPITGFNFSMTSHVHDQIIRVGLNYKLYSGRP